MSKRSTRHHDWRLPIETKCFKRCSHTPHKETPRFLGIQKSLQKLRQLNAVKQNVPPIKSLPKKSLKKNRSEVMLPRTGSLQKVTILTLLTPQPGDVFAAGSRSIGSYTVMFAFPLRCGGVR
jgi:hypothetical protein